MIEIPTYPARPVNGGRLELAPVKRGVWLSEGKWNGWRAVVHTPTGRMWNRHGKPLSIAREFDKALATLKCGVEWLDVEALERRHNIGRGTLIVLDAIVPGVPYEERKALTLTYFPAAELNPVKIECDRVYVSPFVAWDPAILYESLKKYAGFFEGIVMKRSGSPYPFQLRSDEKETVDWVKHRFV
jgi:ATP-dependent DNA ligase